MAAAFGAGDYVSRPFHADDLFVPLDISTIVK
jgi:hypothetical protein